MSSQIQIEWLAIGFVFWLIFAVMMLFDVLTTKAAFDLAPASVGTLVVRDINPLVMRWPIWAVAIVKAAVVLSSGGLLPFLSHGRPRGTAAIMGCLAFIMTAVVAWNAAYLRLLILLTEI